jgi:galactose-1-phosphate uridylyltransferase
MEMTKKEPNKAFQVRMKRSTWLFLKRIAAEQERSMANIIETCVEKYKNKFENTLTHYDTDV